MPPFTHSINAFLDNVDVGDYSVHGDLEAYSCAGAKSPQVACAAGSALYALDVSVPVQVLAFVSSLECVCGLVCIRPGKSGHMKKKGTWMFGLASGAGPACSAPGCDWRPPRAGKLAGLDKKLSRSLDQEVQMGSSPLELSKSPVGPLAESARCGLLTQGPSVLAPLATSSVNIEMLAGAQPQDADLPHPDAESLLPGLRLQPAARAPLPQGARRERSGAGGGFAPAGGFAGAALRLASMLSQNAVS